MERWNGKIAVVTGASSGIGWSIARDLLEAGMQVVGLALSMCELNEKRAELSDALQQAFHIRECDISSLSALQSAFEWIEQLFGRVHVLVNNAGMSETCMLLDEGNEERLQRVIDVNVMGTVNCTKQAYRLMQLAMEAGEECHVITVNSLLGHRVPLHIPDCGLNLYPVAKHALRAAHEVLRRELFKHKLMRLSAISPGLTQTAFGQFGKSIQATDDKIEIPEGILQPEDISRGVLFILSSPPHVTVAELLIMPSRERY